MVLERKLNASDVLTTSASDWCLLRGEDIRDYNPVGVHSDSIEGLLGNLPKDTEVVVGYVYSPNGRVSGTALVSTKYDPIAIFPGKLSNVYKDKK